MRKIPIIILLNLPSGEKLLEFTALIVQILSDYEKLLKNNVKVHTFFLQCS